MRLMPGGPGLSPAVPLIGVALGKLLPFSAQVQRDLERCAGVRVGGGGEWESGGEGRGQSKVRECCEHPSEGVLIIRSFMLS